MDSSSVKTNKLLEGMKGAGRGLVWAARKIGNALVHPVGVFIASYGVAAVAGYLMGGAYGPGALLGMITAGVLCMKKVWTLKMDELPMPHTLIMVSFIPALIGLEAISDNLPLLERGANQEVTDSVLRGDLSSTVSYKGKDWSRGTSFEGTVTGKPFCEGKDSDGSLIKIITLTNDRGEKTDLGFKLEKQWDGSTKWAPLPPEKMTPSNFPKLNCK